MHVCVMVCVGSSLLLLIITVMTDSCNKQNHRYTYCIQGPWAATYQGEKQKKEKAL